jgi:hypothetical protein
MRDPANAALASSGSFSASSMILDVSFFIPSSYQMRVPRMPLAIQLTACRSAAAFFAVRSNRLIARVFDARTYDTCYAMIP